MSSFTGGKLKLKGDVPLKGSVKKKKSKDGASAQAVTAALAEGGTSEGTPALDAAARKAQTDGYSLEGVQAEGADTRTDAERKHAAMVRQREEERLRKLAGKSHRDRIKEFNEYLTNLSEHHDIPKVGPG